MVGLVGMCARDLSLFALRWAWWARPLEGKAENVCLKQGNVSEQRGRGGQLSSFRAQFASDRLVGKSGMILSRLRSLVTPN